MDPNPDQTALNLLRTKRYALFWFSSLLSNIGTWMQQIAQPWVVLTLSQSSLWVGIDSFAMNAPGWIFTLWGGVLADRGDRRKTILLFQGIQLLCVVILVTLLILGWLKVWMIVLISFLVGTTDALSMPSFQSIIPSLVSSKDIPRAVALNSTQFNLSRILGPAIAGIAIARFGAVTCFGANAISYIPFFLSLYWIYPKRIKIHKEPPQQAQPMTQFQEFKKLLTSREVRTPLLTVLVTSLFCSPIITFCPVLIKDIFHSDVEHFGGAMAAFGVGGLIGAALGLFNLPKFLKRDKVSTATAIFLSLVTTTIAFNRSQVLLLGLLVLVGIALTVSNVFANSFLQETSGNHIRGRVVSLFQLALHGGISIGALLTGFTVAQFGISKALIINGVIAGILQIANGLSLKRTS